MRPRLCSIWRAAHDAPEQRRADRTCWGRPGSVVVQPTPFASQHPRQRSCSFARNHCSPSGPASVNFERPRYRQGYNHLKEVALAKGEQMYFSNDLGIPDTIFLKHGLKPPPKQGKLETGNGVVVFAFSYRDIE